MKIMPQYSTQTLIEAKNIACQFDGEPKPLFSGIDINLTIGQQVLVGRNGIGKSWLAAILAGRYLPSEGTVQRFCDVGYLSQGLAPFPGGMVNSIERRKSAGYPRSPVVAKCRCAI